MCCFDHPYSGIFEVDVNRRVVFIGVAAIEIVISCFMAFVGLVEFSPDLRNYLKSHVWIAAVFILIVLIFGLMHCLMFRGPRGLCPQAILVLIVNVSLVWFLVTILSATEGENWKPTGIVSSFFLHIASIKFFGMLFTCCDSVDMTSDWGYLIEFVFGMIFIVAEVVVFIIMSKEPIFMMIFIGAVVAIPWSMLILMDLHQNMSINTWWWEEKLLDGCVYQVFRRFMMTCCVRVEEPPTTIVIIEDPNEQEEVVEEVEVVRRGEQ